jgi:tagatose 6-phosphate kinase
MITLTLNPAIDTLYLVDSFRLDAINRAKEVYRYAGGKGLNVSKVLSLCGIDVVCHGFMGGGNGEQLAQLMADKSLKNGMTPIAGETRVCLNIISPAGATELLEPGPIISRTEQVLFLQQLEQNLHTGELVTISGSLPQGLPSDFYAQIILLAETKGAKVIVDSSGKALVEAVKKKPWGIKINEDEFSQLVSEDLTVGATLQQQMLSLRDIPLIMVTQGNKGATLKYEEQFLQATIPALNVVNVTGSGDSVLAGLCAAHSQQLSTEDLLRFAMACGMSNTQHMESGLIDLNEVRMFQTQVKISRSK